jgi:hypothetical protein
MDGAMHHDSGKVFVSMGKVSLIGEVVFELGEVSQLVPRLGRGGGQLGRGVTTQATRSFTWVRWPLIYSRGYSSWEWCHYIGEQ